MKIRHIASIFVLALTIGIVYLTTSSDANACPVLDPATIEAVYVGDTSHVVVPEGYMLTRFETNGEKSERIAWRHVFGTMEGFDRGQAQKLSVMTEKGKAPCSCSMDGACASFYPPAQCDPNEINENYGGCCKPNCTGTCT